MRTEVNYDVFGYGKDVKKYRKLLELLSCSPKVSHVNYILTCIFP